MRCGGEVLGRFLSDVGESSFNFAAYVLVVAKVLFQHVLYRCGDHLGFSRLQQVSVCQVQVCFRIVEVVTLQAYVVQF